ncbi:MAG: sigma-54 factor interaction domain-containing protein, partial [Leptolyngbya sp. RL_3_1]|nr:sigma-54 factor interaction domain-containing protein [Leptolyngbya sp. RL_3_1]
ASGGLRERPEPLGTSDAWKAILELVDIAAPSDTNVLLLGESGTGKEEVARLLHRRSHRSRGAFVCVNCAAIPTELFESEFFGHRKGAFTGAVADREGRFRVEGLRPAPTRSALRRRVSSAPRPVASRRAAPISRSSWRPRARS